ncbi:hypothetical protein [Streptomyces sp. ISL-100]|uniref:hypothetical protein n=1 Tax=Streptomyces sp. ISL-100 TaxID=2819173 RepID=UPI001BEC8059|nr:hypothetical protein [Streptomyces sp. ISL-100]MBT2397057.1 hypothetical protein [Streptomyces sp. ISL-100]
MLTIHAADLVVPVVGEPVERGAVAVDGTTVVALGPYDEVAAARPTARVRRWPGVLTPGLHNDSGGLLLEHAYFPEEPGEFDELGRDPLTGDALAALRMTEARWGNSARRCTQKLLAHGVVAVTGPLLIPAVRQAVHRAGLTVTGPGTGPGPRPGTADPLADGAPLASVAASPLAVGSRADLAVFDVPDEAALRARGAGTCVATVLGGRLVHRRR